MSIPHNVVFDSPVDSPDTQGTIPTLVINPSQIESLFDLKLAGTMSVMYLITLIIQYICFFITVPFDEVANRPNICIVSSLFDVVMFTICCSIFPMGSAIPSQSSLYYTAITLGFQILGLILSISALVSVLNTDSMYSYQYDATINDSKQVDITTYIQIVTFITLFFHCMGFLLSLINLIICGKGLSYLNNRIDRRTQTDLLEFPKEVPRDITDDHVKVFRG